MYSSGSVKEGFSAWKRRGRFFLRALPRKQGVEGEEKARMEVYMQINVKFGV